MNCILGKSTAGLIFTSRGQTIPLAEQPGAASVSAADLHASALCWLANVPERLCGCCLDCVTELLRPIARLN
ncbi:hypothetical protein Q8A67_018277 [Cirrhinus molitorella]|uniref:Uncharacterized protein n=1 Tax=Cirrhinus molitorella TaxID=172907 RepID=A0AA88TIU4_9TELE|nr:hypothetical protein Q8A67_018277 [Cirrhinus molitorella]